METKKLALSVEWENGVISNEIQVGVKAKYIILKDGEKMLIEPITFALPQENRRESAAIGFLYLKDGKPTLMPGKKLTDNIKEINQTLIGLGLCQSERNSWFWREHSEVKAWSYNTRLSGTRPVVSLGSLD